MHGRWDPVNSAIRAALHGITLADMEASLPRAFRAPAEPALRREADKAIRRGADNTLVNA
jgi:hypothetical protein